MGGETTRVENRGETARGETSWGRNVLLPGLTMDAILGNAVTSQHGALLSDDIKALKTNR